MNELSLIRSEKVLAQIIADRDAVIEGLIKQVDQLQKIIKSMEETRKGATCQEQPDQTPCL